MELSPLNTKFVLLLSLFFSGFTFVQGMRLMFHAFKDNKEVDFLLGLFGLISAAIFIVFMAARGLLGT